MSATSAGAADVFLFETCWPHPILLFRAFPFLFVSFSVHLAFYLPVLPFPGLSDRAM